MEKGNPTSVTVVNVKNFLNAGTSQPVQMKEMQEFWKALSDDEKMDVRRSVVNWDGKSFFC